MREKESKIAEVNLPNFFSFKSANDLIRIGKKNDGGYLVSQSDISMTDVLISLGIGEDWSFEEDFVNKKRVKLLAYDASMGQKYFFRQFIKFLLLINFKLAIIYLQLFFSYKKFFSQTQNHHILKFVGVNTSSNCCTLSSILDRTKSEKIFLKIDIEGSEYRILNTIIANQDRISGLVIEFHDCDLHKDKIETFIQNFILKLVHIHSNNGVHGINGGPVRLDENFPFLLELTFSKYCKVLNETYLPHKFDMPNDKYRPEINLKIKN